MKVLYYAPFGSNFPSRDANSIHIMRMCEAFSNLNHKVTLIVSGRGNREEDIFTYYGLKRNFKIVIVKIPFIKSKTLLYTIASVLRARKIKPDIIIGRGTPSLALSSLFKTDIVYDSHGPVWLGHKFEFLAYRILRKSKNLVRMTTNSAALKEMYLENKMEPPCGITVANNGSSSLPLDEYPEHWPGRKNVMQIGYTGHLYPGRGIEIIIGCAKKLKQFDFHVIGGTIEDIAYWTDKEKLNNLFFHGFIKHSEVYRYRNNCDILLAPYKARDVTMAGGGGDQSKYMNPIKIIEYMSSRKAIICSEVPVLKEILDSETALFCNPDEVEEWIAAIEKLCDVNIRQLFAFNSYNKFQGKLTWESRAKILIGY